MAWHRHLSLVGSHAIHLQAIALEMNVIIAAYLKLKPSTSKFCGPGDIDSIDIYNKFVYIYIYM